MAKHSALVRTLALVMARVLEDAPEDVGLQGVEGVGAAGLVTGVSVLETGRCRKFSSGMLCWPEGNTVLEPLGEAIPKERLTEVMGEEGVMAVEGLGEVMAEEELGEVMAAERPGEVMAAEGLGEVMAEEGLGEVMAAERPGEVMAEEGLGELVAAKRLSEVNGVSTVDIITDEVPSLNISIDRSGQQMRTSRSER